mmetsp:Transcript_2521/g.5866  ORF Transcript_2521/g.5866 Transcript_2521/m.5866 type:complete len:97 (+) Transcript_2521:3301-3591(+)
MERQFKKCTFVNSLMNRPRFDGGETSAESVTTPAITIPNPKPHVNLNMHNSVAFLTNDDAIPTNVLHTNPSSKVDLLPQTSASTPDNRPLKSIPAK